MKMIIENFDITDFEAWSGGKDTLERIIEEDKEKEFESLVEEQWPDGVADTELNDYLWFEDETIFQYLGISDEEAEEEDDDDDEETIAKAIADYEDFDSFCCAQDITCCNCAIRNRTLTGSIVCEQVFEDIKNKA